MRETNQTDKLGRSGEPDKQTKIVRRSNRQIRLFVSVCLVTTLGATDFGRPKGSIPQSPTQQWKLEPTWFTIPNTRIIKLFAGTDD